MATIILSSDDYGKTVIIPAGINYKVHGTSSVDRVSLQTGADAIIWGGGGNDLITLAGSPLDYTVKTDGTSLVFSSSTGHKVNIPLSTEADTLSFTSGLTGAIRIQTGAAGQV